MEDIGIFLADCSIFWAMSYNFGHLVYIFSPFWNVVPNKMWQPCLSPVMCLTKGVCEQCLFRSRNWFSHNKLFSYLNTSARYLS
jgi:hypothetical protein